MKLAGALTLLLALILGGWAMSDLTENAYDSQRLSMNSSWGQIYRVEDQRQTDYFIAAGAAVLLIVSVVLFTQGGKKTVTTQAALSTGELLSKKCPDCAETIKMEALVCRFCGHRFELAEVQATIQQAKSELGKLPN